MDFSFTEEQAALRELTRKILDDLATHERLKAIEAESDWFDRKLWTELAKASLLGIAVPERLGGGGLGLIELCLLLEETGRAAAPVPIFPTLVLGALPIARFGTTEQQEKFLRPVVTGDMILTGALLESGSDDPTRPVATARHDGGRWRLDGTKVCVPAAHLAARVIVPARTHDGRVGVFLLDPQAAGVTLARQQTTTGEPQFQMTLDGAVVDGSELLREPSNDPDGTEVIEWIVDRALVGLCAMEVGVTDRALRMTAEYASTREQFGKPIGSFQAVGQRAADAYIDVETIRWTTWQAIWRLEQGLPAAEEIAVAKFLAAEAGHRVVFAAQHLHGGIGVDLDYPLHRYYLWSKQIELTLGSGTRQLAKLGALMAARPPEPTG